MSCGIDYRHDSDPELLWLRCRPAVVGPIRPLAWKLLYASDVALKKEGEKKKEGAGRSKVTEVAKHIVGIRNQFSQ